MRLERLGKLNYRGYDYDHKPLIAAPGQVIECSEKRGERLMADYPGQWRVVESAESQASLAAGAPDRVASGDTTPADSANPAAGEGATAGAPESQSMGSEPAAKRRGRPRKARP